MNGGGILEREYAIGTDRMDLCLRYGEVTVAMELKVWREGRPDPIKAGLEQIDRYLAGLGLDTGWLVIFDQRPTSGIAAHCPAYHHSIGNYSRRSRYCGDSGMSNPLLPTIYSKRQRAEGRRQKAPREKIDWSRFGAFCCVLIALATAIPD
ncbi:MAG: hypothetical protein RIE73_05320 [Coleofasciculus sp. C1-SOL-03]